MLVEGAEDLFGKADPRRRAALRALEAFPGLAILTTVDPAALDPTLLQRAVTHLRLGLPSAAERRRIWEAHLPPSMPRRGALDLDALANRFDFHGATIRRAVAYAVNAAMAGDAPRPEMTTALLEEGCRVQLEQALDGLTIRSTTHLSLDDLVLAPAVDRRVRELLSACRHQSLIMTAWGLGERLTTGRGITALFDGPPGTGKTYAAEILAGELDRPLHRVNLPEVMSKWLGETEKHVQALFQQARVTHAMLLFDEADSLFGQRVQETKSASDRSANMVVNLLLQEVERFPGIAIMTTNLVSGLDPALMRRIQFRITFAEPDQRERLGIWRVLCPARLPLAPDVDFARLAQHFELSGGRIKNALLRAAYRAVDRGGVVSHELLAEACRDEYVAAGKPPRAD
ncbi:MAG: AAA family ATPase [Myxococcota bacterium]